MTLVQRLLLILLSTVMLLLAASALVIVSNARSTVEGELDSTAGMAIELVTAALKSMPDEWAARSALVEHLHESSQPRGLQMTLLNPASGAGIWSVAKSEAGQVQAPRWFVTLVEPGQREFRQLVSIPDRAPVEIVLVVDPTDEIEETWQETRAIVLLILAFTLLSLLLVTLTIRRALRPLERISDGLQVVAGGDFAARVEEPDLPDLGRLVKQFNQMAATLERQRRENQQLHGRMLQIQETERRKLAQDLHDELGQSITAIKALAVTGGGSQSQAIVDVSAQMYDSVRSLMRQLRPPLLDELGLVSALQKLVDDWNGVHEDCFCALTLDASLEPVADALAIHLYRCVQEGLNNVARHAQANRVDVKLRRSEAGIELSMVDDGRGFEAGQVTMGMGLAGLRERGEACDGTFSLVTAKHQGVSILIRFPQGTAYP